MKISNQNGIGSRQVLDIEIVQKALSNLGRDDIESMVDKFVHTKEYINTHETIRSFTDAGLKEHVESVQLCQGEELPSGEDSAGIHFSTNINYFTFKLNRSGPDISTSRRSARRGRRVRAWRRPPTTPCPAQTSRASGRTSSTTPVSRRSCSGSCRLQCIAMEFADANVDQNIISANKVVLLHGPPGTGKTSLCKALAQKLSIRMQNRYKNGMLIEINSHSLFSKWFSESGKLVMKMFSKIREVIDDPRILVCVLIDEVESLAANRKNLSNDLSDAVRAVNALLTQIDSIKHLPNVLILTTSNITGSIDLAFVDRADIRQFIEIYLKCWQFYAI